MIKKEFEVYLPSSCGKIVDEYNKIKHSIYLESDYVQAYSIDRNLDIIEGRGTIRSNGSWNYHNNYDDSEDVLYFRPDIWSPGVKIREDAGYQESWWTTSYEEVRKIQKRLVSDNLAKYVDIVKELEKKYES
jgi:hypothetical protein